MVKQTETSGWIQVIWLIFSKHLEIEALSYIADTGANQSPRHSKNYDWCFPCYQYLPSDPCWRQTRWDNTHRGPNTCAQLSHFASQSQPVPIHNLILSDYDSYRDMGAHLTTKPHMSGLDITDHVSHASIYTRLALTGRLQLRNAIGTCQCIKHQLVIS